MESVQDLRVSLLKAKEELMHLRIKKASGSLQNTAQIRECRRKVARLRGAITASKLSQRS